MFLQRQFKCALGIIFTNRAEISPKIGVFISVEFTVEKKRILEIAVVIKNFALSKVCFVINRKILLAFGRLPGLLRRRYLCLGFGLR